MESRGPQGVPPNDAYALDAETGVVLWEHKRGLPPKIIVCCGQVNRGFAVAGDRLFMATLDAKVIALDRKTGRALWESEMIDYRLGYAATHAPLVVKDKVLVGVAGGEYGIRGFIDAYSVEDGKRLWRFYTVPGPGEFGRDTWEGDSWKTGGASVWVTGSYDPELNLTYWGTGNPGPDWNGDVRKGDNLFSDAVVALDPDTGERKWHFQFTPHDVRRSGSAVGTISGFSSGSAPWMSVQLCPSSRREPEKPRARRRKPHAVQR